MDRPTVRGAARYVDWFAADESDTSSRPFVARVDAVGVLARLLSVVVDSRRLVDGLGAQDDGTPYARQLVCLAWTRAWWGWGCSHDCLGIALARTGLVTSA